MTTLRTLDDCDVSEADVIGAATSNPVDFAAIFDRHFVTVHRYLSRRVGPSVADDLASETFTIALAKLASYDRSQPCARPWLLGIATNLVRGHRRDEVRLLRALQRTGAAAAVDHADDLAASVAARVSAESAAAPLPAALAELAGSDRDVLLLYAWGSLTYEEIAASLSIPVGTVRSRLHRCRGQVRRALEDTRTQLDRGSRSRGDIR